MWHKVPSCPHWHLFSPDTFCRTRLAGDGSISYMDRTRKLKRTGSHAHRSFQDNFFWPHVLPTSRTALAGYKWTYFLSRSHCLTSFTTASLLSLVLLLQKDLKFCFPSPFLSLCNALTISLCIKLLAALSASSCVFHYSYLSQGKSILPGSNTIRGGCIFRQVKESVKVQLKMILGKIPFSL